MQGYLNNNFVILENFEKKHGTEFFVKGALTSYFERSAEMLIELEQELWVLSVEKAFSIFVKNFWETIITYLDILQRESSS